METNFFYFKIVLIIVLLFSTAESFGYSHSLFSRTDNDKKVLAGTSEDVHQDSSDMLAEIAKRHEILIEKNEDMKKEYQMLLQAKEQLNTELKKTMKKNRPKKRNSRSLKAAKRFREKKEKFNVKYADFLSRKEALDKELNELRERMTQLSAVQPSS
jgi:chromosome segregation ATPase